MKKITNAIALTAIIEAMENMETPIHSEFSNSEIMEKLIAMRECIQRKSSAPRKPSAKQAENDLIRKQIMDVMADGVWRDISTIRDNAGMPIETTPQRVSGLLKPLIADGLLISKEIKRKKFYAIPESADAE